MATADKAGVVDEITKRFKDSKSVFLTDFTGLNVQQMTELRRAFRRASVHYEVVKNTLARRSAQFAEYDSVIKYLEGPTALAFGISDPSAPARVIKEFKKSTDKLQIKACLFEGVLIGPDRIEEVANLPSREILLGRVLGVLNAPVTKLAFSLNAVLSKLAFAVDAVRKQKEASP
ncbi:MAG TPA: 50S ribosomal protein L10 [bacterium]